MKTFLASVLAGVLAGCGVTTPAFAQEDVGICAASYCADVNNDGVTVATDALAALRIAVGLSVTEDFCGFTVCEGNHCVTDVLPISSLHYPESDEVACFVGRPD